MSPARLSSSLLALLLLAQVPAFGQKIAVPRRHDRPPGPALTPEQAVQRMTVPEGFHVEIVASEPDVVNPVAMFIDEKGRFWVTESFEYPRREPGPGRDRIKVLEDTDDDGKVDKVTIFAEGLNIPSGIAVGYGGVWIANAPDLLFLQDTDGDLKADKTEVLVTGFGRTDTHELPNSLTWGPDGWLYGLNGVFNYCDVHYGPGNPNFKADHSGWKFTCAVWRIHPRTKEFQIWAEGTSNPWGIAFNDDGEMFLSACVIDHLWHMTETGYYIRQGGPYPPHTWPIGSIVKHKHQKAAYCGITWFDSDCYPEPYRNVLYMGNIHGGCINADVLERNGSTYAGKPHPGFPAKAGAFDLPDNTIAKTGDEKSPKLADLLTANDPWFMPVAQKTGPDGCLYILDWYDRYHCYQDANADPEGIDRGNGRLYRLVYGGRKKPAVRDLATLEPTKLAEAAINGGNEYVRETARQILAEKLSVKDAGSKPALDLLHAAVADPKAARAKRLRALWTLASGEKLLTADDLKAGLETHDVVAGWSLRLLADREAEFRDLWLAHLGKVLKAGIATTEDPGVVLQTVIAISKIKEWKSAPLAWIKVSSLGTLLNAGHKDPLIPSIVWQNLHPLLDQEAAVDTLLELARGDEVQGLEVLMPRALARIQSRSDLAPAQTVRIYERLSEGAKVGQDAAGSLLYSLVTDVQSGAVHGDRRAALKQAFTPKLAAILAKGPEAGHHWPALLLSGSWGDQQGVSAIKAALESKPDDGRQIELLKALIASGDIAALEWSRQLLDRPALQEQVLFLMSRMDRPEVGQAVVRKYSALGPHVQPKAIELLTQRGPWAGELLAAVEAKQIAKEALNLNQLRRVGTFKDEGVQNRFKALYGVLREGRNPDREQVINRTRDFLHGTPGDPMRGQAVFKKVCAQCHKIYGEGVEVGPDITSNGRASFEQMLSNVLDPSLVIGNGYQARILITADGRVLTGLPVEDSPERVILKVQGGKTETIPRDQIDEFRASEVSMMPEQLEKQLTPQELADLFSFIGLDKPPTDPAAKRLPGVPAHGK